MIRAKQVFESCLYVEDLEAAKRFYQTVMGLELVSENVGRGLAFRCGYGVVLVFDPRRTKVRDRAVAAHGCDGAGHLAFLARPEELDRWRAHLQACGVPIETEVDWPEGGRSIYFRDPGGNSIELAPPTLWGFGGG